MAISTQISQEISANIPTGGQTLGLHVGGIGRGKGLRFRSRIKGGKRPVADEDLTRLDLRDLAKQNYVGAGHFGVWPLPTGGSVNVEFENYHPPKRMWVSGRRIMAGATSPFFQTVFLDWTACNYGGQRPWFRCPACDRRSLVLWGSYFHCRQCVGLAYASQNYGTFDRLVTRMHAVRGRLGCTGPFDPPPDRPKWMRRRKWCELKSSLAAKERAISEYCGMTL